jgi:hypothetical protein
LNTHRRSRFIDRDCTAIKSLQAPSRIPGSGLAWRGDRNRSGDSAQVRLAAATAILQLRAGPKEV